MRRRDEQGFVEHVFANAQYQAGFLGHGDEVRRGDEAAILLRPAEQGLGGRHATTLRLGNRLIGERQFALVQGLVQLVLDLEFAGRGSIGFGKQVAVRAKDRIRIVKMDAEKKQ